MRKIRVLFLLALVTLMPVTLSAAAPKARPEAPRLERLVKLVKRFVAGIQSRITVPIGSPSEEEPPTEQTNP